jgi:hypothetical protein
MGLKNSKRKDRDMCQATSRKLGQHLNFRSVEGRRCQILIFDYRATGVAVSC